MEQVKDCQNCLKKFPRTKRKGFSSSAWAARKYCTHICFLKARVGVNFSAEHKQKIAAASTGPKISRSCKNCSIDFLIPVYVVNRKDKQQGIYCSRKCKNKNIANERRGEKHHNWKGGVLPIHTYIRHSAEYRVWRMGVFKRDNFTRSEEH